MKTVISRDGTAIAYDQVGAGPAVILVGGAFSYRAYPPKALAPVLEEFFLNTGSRGRAVRRVVEAESLRQNARST